MRIRFSALLLLALTLGATAAVPPPDRLYTGWLQMYDLKFASAHQFFHAWQDAHPQAPLAWSSDAAAYLFAEFARLGILQSGLFVDDDRFSRRQKLRPDAALKTLFLKDLAEAEKRADSALAASPNDRDALLAKCLDAGLQADYAALIDKENIPALRYTKVAGNYSDKLLAVDPSAYDAYLAPGIENYLLSLKPALLKIGLRLSGSHVDADEGLKDLRITAAHGFYLEPFAKLWLALIALRDKDQAEARKLLTELHQRFPDNPLYLQELTRMAAVQK